MNSRYVSQYEFIDRQVMAANGKKIDLKVIFLGSSGAGKTSLILKYTQNRFESTMSTIGASFVLKSWNNFKLGIWDTAGQEKYSTLSSFYCRGAGAAVVAYDITCRRSFDELERFFELIEKAELECYIVVVGTKLDLVEEKAALREVSVEEGKQCAALKGGVFFETSSKTGEHVNEVFERIGQHCLEGSRIKRLVDTAKNEADSICVTSIDEQHNTQQKCCS